MVSSIGSSMNSAAMMSNSMSRPPEGKNAFTVSDTNEDGVVSDSELTALAEGLAETTGQSVEEITATMSEYGSEDGLTGEEMHDMLSNMGILPSEMQGEGGGPPPPPPPSTEEAISAYSENSGSDDLLTTLLDTLQGDSETSVNTTT